MSKTHTRVYAKVRQAMPLKLVLVRRHRVLVILERILQLLDSHLEVLRGPILRVEVGVRLVGLRVRCSEVIPQTAADYGAQSERECRV